MDNLGRDDSLHSTINVKLAAWPRSPQPYANVERRQPLLVVGVGLAGYHVLRVVVEHANATLLDLDKVGINLIYVDFVERSRGVLRPNYLPPDPIPPIHEYVLRGQEEESNAYHGRGSQPHWHWWFMAEFHHQTGRSLRHAARAILFDHLQTEGDASPLLLDLRQKWLQANTQVIIVGSALEYAGTNVIPDLAVLLRRSAPSHANLIIHTLALMDEKSLPRVGLDSGSEDIYRAATCFELAYYRSQAAPRLTVHPQYSFEGYRPLLNSVYCVPGRNNEGVQAAGVFLWGLCLSSKLLETLSSAGATDTVGHTEPQVNFLFARGEFAPVVLRRQLWYSHIKLRTIHRNYLPARMPFAERVTFPRDDLPRMLRDRHVDLLEPVMFINENIDRPSPQIRRLEMWLRELAGKAYETQQGVLQQLESATHLSGERFREWARQPTGLPEMGSMAWEFADGHSVRDGLVMRFGQDAPYAPIRDDESFSTYERCISSFALNCAHLFLDEEVSRLERMLPQDQNLQHNFATQHEQWSDMLVTLSNNYPVHDNRWLALGFGNRSWNNRLTALDDGNDRTGCFHFLLSNRIPIGTLSYLVDLDLRRLQDGLIHPALHHAVKTLSKGVVLLQDRMHFYKLPPIFFSLLDSSDLFNSFFWCWYNETLPGLFEGESAVFQVPGEFADYDSSTWRQRIQAFLRNVGESHQRAQVWERSFLPMPSDLPPVVTDGPSPQDSEDATLSRFIYDLFNDIADLVEIDLTTDDEVMCSWIAQRRLLFEFFLCWNTGKLDDLRLRGRTWVQRLEAFRQMVQRDWSRIRELQQGGPAPLLNTVTYPTGDEQADLLSQIFDQWRRNVNQSNLPLLRR